MLHMHTMIVTEPIMLSGSILFALRRFFSSSLFSIFCFFFLAPGASSVTLRWSSGSWLMLASSRLPRSFTHHCSHWITPHSRESSRVQVPHDDRGMPILRRGHRCSFKRSKHRDAFAMLHVAIFIADVRDCALNKRFRWLIMRDAPCRHAYTLRTTCSPMHTSKLLLQAHANTDTQEHPTCLTHCYVT